MARLTCITWKRLIIPVLAGISIIGGMIFNQATTQRDVLERIRLAEPDAERLESLPGDYPAFKIWTPNQPVPDFGIITHASGYNGKITVLSLITPVGNLKKTIILNSNETSSYLNMVQKANYIEGFSNQSIQTLLSTTDTVSGATVSSRAIKSAINKGLVQVGKRYLDMELEQTNPIRFVWYDIVTLFLIGGACVLSVKKKKKARPWLLAVSVLIIGFVANASLSLGNYVCMLSGSFPAWRERPLWVVMVPGICLLTGILGKNIYCGYICPFGAVQEGVYHSLNLYRFNPSLSLRTKARKARWPMIWFVTMTALLFNQFGIAGYEPFSAFFDSTGTTSHWIILGFTIIISMAHFRFWCRYFCPVGAVLTFFARIKRRFFKTREYDGADGINILSNGMDPNQVQLNNGRQNWIFIIVVVIMNGAVLMSIVNSIITL